MILEPLGDGPEPPTPLVPAGPLLCLSCHVQAHNARAAGMSEPPVNPAQTIANGCAICFDHLQIGPPSSLIVPPGTQLPRMPGG
jgi:hypothetical protein